MERHLTISQVFFLHLLDFEYEMVHMMMATAISCFISGRIDGNIGATSLFSFLMIVLFRIAYERLLD